MTNHLELTKNIGGNYTTTIEPWGRVSIIRIQAGAWIASSSRVKCLFEGSSLKAITTQIEAFLSL